jgi:hypothetical protein
MNDPRDEAIGQSDPTWLEEALRRSLPPEYERQVADLRSGYVRLQWRTLGSLLGVAFVCGIGLTLAMPWIRTQLGDWAPLLVAGGGALVGIALGARSWLRPGLRGPALQWLGSLWNGA